MADENELESQDDTEDFAESLAVSHHLAILDLIEAIKSMNGAPADRLDEIRESLVAMLPPEDIELMQ